MSNIILCNLSDAIQVINEARLDWIKTTLSDLGVPENILEIKDIRELRYELSDNFGIEVDLFFNGDVHVYKKQWNNSSKESLQGWLPVKKEHLVAQWKEPKRIRKVEGKNVYYEIHLDEWTATIARK